MRGFLHLAKLLKKFSFTENEDCRLEVTGDEYEGVIEMYISGDVRREHEGYWGDRKNPTQYYKNGSNNPDIIGFIDWYVKFHKGTKGIEIFINFVEVMEPYRGKKAFKLILSKFKEVVVDKIVSQKKDSDVYINAVFQNSDLHQYLYDKSEEVLGVPLKENVFNKKLYQNIKTDIETNNDSQSIEQYIDDENFDILMVVRLFSEGVPLKDETIIRLCSLYPNLIDLLISKRYSFDEKVVEKITDINPQCISIFVNNGFSFTDEKIVEAMKLSYENRSDLLKNLKNISYELKEMIVKKIRFGLHCLFSNGHTIDDNLQILAMTENEHYLTDAYSNMVQYLVQPCEEAQLLQVDRDIKKVFETRKAGFQVYPSVWNKIVEEHGDFLQSNYLFKDDYSDFLSGKIDKSTLITNVNSSSRKFYG
jgi:hypothetical protein